MSSHTVESGLSEAAAPDVRDPRLSGQAGEDRNASLYRDMLAIRRFEERLLSLFDEGALTGTTHCCIGQEADCVGVIKHLEPGDHVFSNHRCHGHYLAQTGDAVGLLAEIMGKRSGVCGGIGGSQHLWAVDFKSNGILGGTVPAAAGIAMAEQLRGNNRLSVVFVGDGALGEGVVYETLNIASLWQLPLLVVVEDNAWSQSTPRQLNLAGDIVSRFEAFGIATTSIDSTDVLEIDAVAEKEVRLAREAPGPRALVIHTYRLCHHSKNDDNRPLDEVQSRHELDPVRVHGRRLDEAVRRRIDDEVREAIEAVVEMVRTLP
jgi:acetoin:2,6-dichlorophenolindophenol oxidoreductase subunit alpha